MRDAMMRAVAVVRPGGPEVLKVVTRPAAEAPAGHVVVRTAGAGVNRADLLQRMGRYPAPPGWPPDIPGLECAGTVVRVGEGVEGVGEGDRVMAILGGGGYAEEVVVPASILVSVPDSLDLVEAGGVPEVFMTAFDAVFLQERLRSGETLLVHAVGSGVGTAALQLAIAAGARVIGTSRSPAKLERARELGLEHAVPAQGWADEVLRITGGRGVDVILDLVGGPYLADNQVVLAPRGRHIVVGVPGGSSATLDLRALMGRRASIRGTVLRARPVEEKAELAMRFRERVLPLLASGRVRPVIDRVLPAERAAEAHRALEHNETFGKIVLTWDGAAAG